MMETETLPATDDTPDIPLMEFDDAPIAVHGPFRLSPTGVETDREATYEEWQAATVWVQQVQEAAPWWVADLLSYGENRYGDKYSQAIEATGLTAGTLMNIQYVGRAVPKANRRAGVSFAHHQEVASLPSAQQVTWLEKAELDNLTREQLRSAIKVEKAVKAGTPVELWLLVKCTDTEDATALATRLRGEGRAVKLHAVHEGEDA